MSVWTVVGVCVDWVLDACLCGLSLMFGWTMSLMSVWTMSLMSVWTVSLMSVWTVTDVCVDCVIGVWGLCP